jgi:DNA-binding GntR family transcriptional regulator
MHNAASFPARRTILEYAYKTTRERVAQWVDNHRTIIDRTELRPMPVSRRP